jgi:hypothetical protein
MLASGGVIGLVSFEYRHGLRARLARYPQSSIPPIMQNAETVEDIRAIKITILIQIAAFVR